MKLLQSFLLVCGWLLVRVRGQRLKEGCFDADPFFCYEKELPAFDSITRDVNAEGVCIQLALDIFPTEEILLDTSLHPEYLNSIEAGTELCQQIRQSYHQCFFCATDGDFKTQCLIGAYLTNCGGQPTYEEVLALDGDYARYETPEDIDAACTDLQKAYQTVYLKDKQTPMPSTIRLCESQSLVKHLCPGHCDGGCFNFEEEPPTCDIPNDSGTSLLPFNGHSTSNDTLDVQATCGRVGRSAFFNADPQVILDPSLQEDYLRAIPGNTTLCDQAKQVYPHCFWCASEMCFNDDHPVSCEVPEDPGAALINYEHWDFTKENTTAQDVCIDIHLYFFDLIIPEDYYNISKHTGHLLIPGNSVLCDQARHFYHVCSRCSPQPILQSRYEASR